MGPNGSGKTTLAHVPDGPGRLRGARRLGDDRRRGAARAAHVAAGRARAVPGDAVPGRGAGRAGRRHARDRAPGARAGNGHGELVPRLAAEAERLHVDDAVPRAGSERRVLGRREEAGRDAAARGARAEVRGARRDRLRSRRRRAARRVPPHRGDDARERDSACSRSRTTPGCSPSCVPTACTCSWAAQIVQSGGPELADTLERVGYEGLAAELGVETLTVEPEVEADPFADPTIELESRSPDRGPRGPVHTTAGVVVARAEAAASCRVAASVSGGGGGGRSSGRRRWRWSRGGAVARRRGSRRDGRRAAEDVDRLAVGHERVEVLGDVHRDARAAVRRGVGRARPRGRAPRCRR